MLTWFEPHHDVVHQIISQVKPRLKRTQEEQKMKIKIIEIYIIIIIEFYILYHIIFLIKGKKIP